MKLHTLFLIISLCPLNSMAIVDKVPLSQNKLWTFRPSEHITLCTHESVLEIRSEQESIVHWNHRASPVFIDAESDFRFDKNGFREDSKCPLASPVTKELPRVIGKW